MQQRAEELDPRTSPKGLVMNNGKARYYNTGKVLIGCAFQARMPAMSKDSELIQAALLNKGTPLRWGLSRHVTLALLLLGVFLILSDEKTL